LELDAAIENIKSITYKYSEGTIKEIIQKCQPEDRLALSLLAIYIKYNSKPHLTFTLSQIKSVKDYRSGCLVNNITIGQYLDFCDTLEDRWDVILDLSNKNLSDNYNKLIDNS
jgi:hypothetical protein